MLFFAALLLPAAVAAASDARVACVAYSELDKPVLMVAANPTAWDCSGRRPSLTADRALLRFAVDPAAPLPRYFVTRRSALAGIHVVAIAEDGSAVQHDYSPADLKPANPGNFLLTLPEITPKVRDVIVAIDLPTHVMSIRQAHLSAPKPGASWSDRRLLVMLAGLCGMLAMPLIYNFAFYRVLREPFVLWHSVLTGALMGSIVFNSGLSSQFFDLTEMQIDFLTGITFGASVAAGGMFVHSFIEPGKLAPGIRRLLPVSAVWSMVVSIVHASFPELLRAWQTDIYYAAYLPVLILYIWAVGDSLARGSRSAKFQAVGWAPLLTVGILRQLGQLTSVIEPTDALMLFYAGTVLEVIATTLGVADRFMSIKQQRDLAWNEARLLGDLSERDALTGLLNRRALQERFTRLRHEGFVNLALIDLDRFKEVNDLFGHQIGDRVLHAVGGALVGDSEARAFRMGGEEFLLLLRGDDAGERAEWARQAISLRVASEVSGLDRTVTASMGLIEMSIETMPNARFEELYSHADRLLYEAKESGRNRTVSERLREFRRRKSERRKEGAGAA